MERSLRSKIPGGLSLCTDESEPALHFCNRRPSAVFLPLQRMPYFKACALVLMNKFRISLTSLALAAVGLAQSAAPAPASDIPENLGLGLRELVELSQQNPSGLQRQLTSSSSINADAANRVVANIQLNGKVPPGQVQMEVAALGAEIIAI